MTEEIPIELIDPNPFQSRREFNEEKLQELAASIKKQGLLQNIEVRPHNGRYQLIYGDRRVRAFKLLNRKTIHAMIREASDLEMHLRALIENVQRTDLVSYEHEEAVHNLWTVTTANGERHYKTKQQLADDLGYSHRTIRRLLNAYDLRNKHSLAATISTRVIDSTEGLSESDRISIIEKVQKTELGENEVRAYVQAVKAMNSDVRRAVLRSPLEVEDAVMIAEIEKPDRQQAMLNIVTDLVQDKQRTITALKEIAEGKRPPIQVLESEIDKFYKRYKRFYSGVLAFDPKRIAAFPRPYQEKVLFWVRHMRDRMQQLENEILQEVGEIPVVHETA